MEKYGTTREQLAMVSVINHRHGALNPDAQFQREITVDTVLKSGYVAEPLRVFDMSPLSDGAAALVLASEEMAKKFSEKPVRIAGIGQASDTISLHDRRDITTMDATVYAAKRAYEMAGIKPEDVDVAEVYDSSTISEIMAIEDLGFFEKGKGGKAAEDEEIALGGRIPVNTSGGLKARGHPIGATGVAQIVEIARQLRGEADKRQVKDARIGLAHAIGGTGGTAVVSILEGYE
jgi:acetyl-CoA C-acetyltransferase